MREVVGEPGRPVLLDTLALCPVPQPAVTGQRGTEVLDISNERKDEEKESRRGGGGGGRKASLWVNITSQISTLGFSCCILAKPEPSAHPSPGWKRPWETLLTLGFLPPIFKTKGQRGSSICIRQRPRAPILKPEPGQQLPQHPNASG